MMDAKVEYFETGTKTVRYAEGKLFFGDALLGDYLGVKMKNNYLLIPTATVITIEIEQLDEELYMVDTENMRRSKQIALRRIDEEIIREGREGRAFE
jgi:hypothetical protein